MGKLKMGVIGLGLGRGHARGYHSHPQAELVAVWQQKAGVVAGYLKALPPDADPDVRTAILGILADAPQWLKPDPFGNFDPAATNFMHVTGQLADTHEPLGVGHSD